MEFFDPIFDSLKQAVTSISPEKAKPTDYIELTRELDSNGMFPVFYITKCLLDKISDTGCFILMIKSSNGANGIFCLSKSERALAGNVTTLCSSYGPKKEKISVAWHPFEFPSVHVQFSSSQKDLPQSITLAIKVLTL